MRQSPQVITSCHILSDQVRSGREVEMEKVQVGSGRVRSGQVFHARLVSQHSVRDSKRQLSSISEIMNVKRTNSAREEECSCCSLSKEESSEVEFSGRRMQ